MKREEVKHRVLKVIKEQVDKFFDEDEQVYLFGKLDITVKMKDGLVAKINSSISESILV